MIPLKQSTSYTFKLGPFVDATDGVTPENGLTIANTDIKLSKNGGTLTSKNSGGGTIDADGWYTVTFNTTDTDTLGTLQVSCQMSGALPVWGEFVVMEANTYDMLYSSDGKLGASAKQIIRGTVATATTSPNYDNFSASDITEATADHYIGRAIIFTSGALTGQATRITDYALVSGEGNFTVDAMTDIPSNSDTFIIV